MKLAGWVTLISVIIALVWAGMRSDNWQHAYPFNESQRDYYNLLTDGLLEGHLHMNVALDSAGQLPYLMDASRYQDKYYMYFGVVPALLTFLPYAYLTGHDLPENAVSCLLVVGGLLLNIRLYVLARRRYFPVRTVAMEVSSIILLALGTGTPILVFDSGFYEVALAGGYLCVSATMLALYQAIHSERWPTLWLAAASLAAGLAVGCRPTYILILPVLLIPLVLRIRPSQARRIRLLGATIIPAGIIGLAIMAYNYGRFHDPFEFGFKYQVNALMDSALPFTSVRFICPNLTWYYLSPPVLSLYFPYVLPINASPRPMGYYGYEQIHGQWLVLLLGLITLAGIIGFKSRGGRIPLGLALISGCALLAFGGVFATLLSFGFRANRYVTDFQPCLILAITLVSGFIASPAAATPRRLDLPFRYCFLGLALAVSLFNFLVGIQWMDRLANSRPKTYHTLAYYGNYPSHWLGKLGWYRSGSYRFHVRFKPQTEVVTAPLFTTGGSGVNDSLYVIQHQNNLVEFSLLHPGYTSVKSDTIAIDFTHEYEVEVFFGSLFPPIDHPLYQNWDPLDVLRAKTTLRVLFDHKEILRAHQRFNDASPFQVYFGSNPATGEPPFSGYISSIEFLPWSSADLAKNLSVFGLWQFELELPPTGSGPQPLLAAGSAGHGNLLSLEVTRPDQIRFGLDPWGFEASRSDFITVPPQAHHHLEVYVGPQVARQTLPAHWSISAANVQANAHRLKVWLDGRLTWDTAILGNLASYEYTAIADNPQGFSTASRHYNNNLRNIPLSDDDKIKMLRRNLLHDGFGLWRLHFVLPAYSQDFQPLLSSGYTGYGNLLGIEYVNSQAIRLGHDEWGSEMAYSPTIEVDPTRPHQLEIFVGPQIARQNIPPEWNIDPADVQAHAGRLYVWLDGQLVWNTFVLTHHDTYNDTVVGHNPQGFSTASPDFAGSLHELPLTVEDKKNLLERNLSVPVLLSKP